MIRAAPAKDIFVWPLFDLSWSPDMSTAVCWAFFRHSKGAAWGLADISLYSDSHELSIGVNAAPETMPAVLKHTTVPRFGYVPAVFTHSRGELPVVLSMPLSIAYLAFL